MDTAEMTITGVGGGVAHQGTGPSLHSLSGLCSLLSSVLGGHNSKRPEVNNLLSKSLLSSWFGRFQYESGLGALGLQWGC